MRDRAGRDENGKFVGISCDSESPVDPVVGAEVDDASVERTGDGDEAASVGTQEEDMN